MAVTSCTGMDGLVVDFSVLGETNPGLLPFLRQSGGNFKNTLVNWHDPVALRAVTRAILKTNFNINSWEILPNRLCPPVPNRFEYLCWIHYLMGSSQNGVRGIDIGTGASCIYPLMGSQAFNWKWLATEIDTDSHLCATKNVIANNLSSSIEVRKVESSNSRSDSLIYDMIKEEGGSFDFCVCNPPFFSSESEAQRDHPHHACPGAMVEMVCDGGEYAFLARLISDSVKLGTKVKWYTAMTGKKETLKFVMKELRCNTHPKPVDVRSTVLNIGTSSAEVRNVDSGSVSEGSDTVAGERSRTRRWVVAWSFDPAVASLNLPKMNALSKKRVRPATNGHVNADMDAGILLVEIPARISKQVKVDLRVDIPSQEVSRKVHFVATPLRLEALSSAPRAIDMDRTSDPPNLFSCDICGRKIAAGLAGFEVYYSCSVCEEFDICADCAGITSTSKKRKGNEVKVKAHFQGKHKFKYVDRNYDSCDSEDDSLQSIEHNVVDNVVKGESRMDSIKEESTEIEAVTAPRADTIKSSIGEEDVEEVSNEAVGVSALDLLHRFADLVSSGHLSLPNLSHELKWYSMGVVASDTVRTTSDMGSASGVEEMERVLGQSLTGLANSLDSGESVVLRLMGKSSNEAEHFIAAIDCSYSTINGTWEVRVSQSHGEWVKGFKLFTDVFPGEVLRSNRRWRRRLKHAEKKVRAEGSSP